MKIAIGSDKSGFTLKEEIKNHLTTKGYEVSDFGLLDANSVMPYFEVAPRVAKKIQEKEFERGILICGTGAGMAIVANKFKGIYAVSVESSYTAKMSGIVNKANIITLGGWVVAPQQAFDMVDNWLSANFTEGFPEDRQRFLCNAYKQVGEIEDDNFVG